MTPNSGASTARTHRARRVLRPALSGLAPAASRGSAPRPPAPPIPAVWGTTLYFNPSTAAGYRVGRFDGTNAARVTNANPPYAFFDPGFWRPVVWFGELWYPNAGKVYRFDGERFANLNTPPFAQMDLVLWNVALYY